MKSKKLLLGILVLLLLLNYSAVNGQNSISYSISHIAIQHNFLKDKSEDLLNESPKSESAVFLSNFIYTHVFIRSNLREVTLQEIAQRFSEVTLFTSRHFSKVGCNQTRELIELTLSSEGIYFTRQWLNISYNGKTYHTANVIAILGNRSNLNNVSIYIAHYDSLAYNFAGRETIDDSPGADDDASGVVALLTALTKINTTRFIKTIVIAFVTAETYNHYGIAKLISFLKKEKINVTAAYFIDQVGYEKGKLAFFDRNGILSKRISSIKRAMNFNFEYLQESRLKTYLGNGEYLLSASGIPTVAISEENYTETNAFTIDDTSDSISLKKIKNATLLLQSLFLLDAYELPRNNTIVTSWIKNLRTQLHSLDIKDPNITAISEIIAENKTIIVSPLTELTSAELHILEEARKIIFLGRSAQDFYLTEYSKKTIGLEYNFIPKLSKNSFRYHPIIEDINISKFLLRSAYTFELSSSDVLLSPEETSSVLTVIYNKSRAHFIFGVIEPNEQVTRLIKNIVLWNIARYTIALEENRKITQGINTQLSIKVFETEKWEPVKNKASVSVISAFSGVLMAQWTDVNISQWFSLAFMPKYPKEYIIIAKWDGGEARRIINTTQTIFAIVHMDRSIVQGDMLKIHLKFINKLSEKQHVLPIVKIENSTIPEVSAIDIPTGVSSVSISTSRIWKNGTLHVHIHLENTRVFITQVDRIVNVSNAIKIEDISYPKEIIQGNSIKLELVIQSNFSSPTSIRVEVDKPFLGEPVTVKCYKNNITTVFIEARYEEKNMYDFGRRLLKIDFISPSNATVMTLIIPIEIKPSQNTLVFGFVIPLGLIWIVVSIIAFRIIIGKDSLSNVLVEEHKIIDVIDLPISDYRSVLENLGFRYIGRSIQGFIFSKGDVKVTLRKSDQSTIMKIIANDKEELDKTIECLEQTILN